MGAGASLEMMAQMREATLAAIRAEVARVKALPAEERATLGDKYTDPEKLWLALEAGDGEATLVLSAHEWMVPSQRS